MVNSNIAPCQEERAKLYVFFLFCCSQCVNHSLQNQNANELKHLALRNISRVVPFENLPSTVVPSGFSTPTGGISRRSSVEETPKFSQVITLLVQLHHCLQQASEVEIRRIRSMSQSTDFTSLSDSDEEKRSSRKASNGSVKPVTPEAVEERTKPLSRNSSLSSSRRPSFLLLSSPTPEDILDEKVPPNQYLESGIRVNDTRFASFKAIWSFLHIIAILWTITVHFAYVRSLFEASPRSLSPVCRSHSTILVRISTKLVGQPPSNTSGSHHSHIVKSSSKTPYVSKSVFLVAVSFPTPFSPLM